MKEYQPKYWNHKGRYQKAHDLLYKFLQIPSEGPAATGDGNKLRLLNNQYYQKFNNGVGRLSAEELDLRVDGLVLHLVAKYMDELLKFKGEEKTNA